MLTIALDYDHTYSADPFLWDAFILQARSRGHYVFICTARNEILDAIEDDVLEGTEIAYCDGVAKKFTLHHHFGIDVDIWIDDKPDSITHNSTASKEVLEAWRANR